MSLKGQPMAEIDTENINPSTLKHSTKRKRDSNEDESLKESPKPIKSSRTAFTSLEQPPTPCTPITLNAPSTPKSAPASAHTPIRKPAGRSPQLKSSKLPSSRRSSIAKQRFEPGTKKSVRRPFSLATALSNAKPKPQSSAKTPSSSWFFDIHEDSEQDEMTNLMQHSTCVLDISDDEGKRVTDGRGKENIPPPELEITIPRSTRQRNSSASQKAVEMEEDRSPLGELSAADYYADGCHAFSHVVVYDDECESSTKETGKKPAPFSKPTSHVRRSSALQNVESISAILEAAAPSKPEEPKAEPSDQDFEIWESGSAAEEAEADNADRSSGSVEESSS